MGTDGHQVPELEPLPGKVAREVEGARIGEQPAGLPLQLVRTAQLAANRRIEQLVVGNAAPEEERQPRRQLQVADAVRARSDLVRVQLHAEEELGIDEHGAQGLLDAVIEAARGTPFAVEGQRSLDVLGGDRPAVGATHQGGENLPCASLFIARRIRPADEEPLPARRVAGALRCVRPGDRHLVDGGRLAWMPRLVVVRLQRLTLGLQQRPAVLGERDAELVRPGGYRRAHLQVAVEQRVVAVNRPRHREAPDRHPVEQQLQLVRARVAQAADIAAAVARQQHLDVVLPVLRERVRHEHAAASADRQPRHVLFLGRVRGHPDHGALDRLLTRPDSQPANLARGRNVAVEQCGRQVAHGHVVEAVAALVRGQERRRVDIESQQVADGVLVLGAVEAPERLRAARIRILLRRGVQRCLQPLEHGLARLGGRLRPVGRRHGAGAQLLHHRFPCHGPFGDVQSVYLLETEPRGLEAVVVAGHAVAVEQLPAVRGAGRRRRRGRRCHGGGRRSQLLRGKLGGQAHEHRQGQPRVKDADPGDGLPHNLMHPGIVGFDPVKHKEEVALVPVAGTLDLRDRRLVGKQHRDAVMPVGETRIERCRITVPPARDDGRAPKAERPASAGAIWLRSRAPERDTRRECPPCRGCPRGRRTRTADPRFA